MISQADASTQHMKAIEHNNPPDDLQVLQGAGYNPAVHGFDGPVNVSFPTPMRIPLAQSIYKAAIPLAFPGLEVTSDLSDRINSASASNSWTIWHDSENGINRRSSAAYALLYAEKQQRSTLTVLAEHRVAKIIWDGKDKNTPTAKGVFFGNPAKGNTLYAVYAKKEVILAAGALGVFAFAITHTPSAYRFVRPPPSSNAPELAPRREFLRI